MPSAAANTIRIPVKIADCFLLSLDSFMRKTGQGAHVSQSVLELDSCPNPLPMRQSLGRFSEKHPLLCARLRRNWKTWLPYWEAPVKRPPFPLDLWRERGSIGQLGGASEIDDATSFLTSRLAEPARSGGRPFNARLDLVERRDGHYLVALTWSHRILDGKGAEMLLADFARLCEGIDDTYETREIPRPLTTLREKRQAAHALLCRFDQLAALGVHSLGGPQPRPGPCRFQLVTLDESDSGNVRERANQLCGPLFSLPYFLACASRAHAAVFAKRGKNPNCYVSGVPIQTRKRGSKGLRGPLFHNQVSVFFFCSERADIASLETATTALKSQFAEMTRDKLDESFTTMLEIMMRMPSWLFMKIVRWQFKGEINSFFYSHTGVFAPDLTHFSGAEIVNAWHLPCLGRPPGTGLFFSERNDKLTITLSWREGCLSSDERQLMIDQILEDLLGRKQPELTLAM